MWNSSISSISKKAKALVQLERKKNRPFKPVIISDIDGVLVRGHTPIPKTLQAMQAIHAHKIPFACLTNGGGRTEKVKAQNLNKCFNKNLFSGQSMFLNHTPMKPEIIRYSKMPGNILISGSLNIISIMEELNIKNYLITEQLYANYFHERDNCLLQKEDTHFHFYQRTLDKAIAIERMEKRIGRKIGTFEQQSSQITGIFALNDVSPYQTTLTVIHNILKQRKDTNVPMPYFAAQNDIVWAGGYFKPRIAFGPFNYLLDQHCKRHKLDLIEHIYYGKPQLKAFKFVEEEMKKRQSNGVFFMMGDNPKADIRGANNIGWYSFLTQTGIHVGPENDLNDPATFVVENFHEAVQIILAASKELS